MAASLETAPPSPAYNGNDIWLRVESDLVNTSIHGYVDIFSQIPGEPALGETLELTWGGSSVLLTVEATKNAAATAIPLRGVGESLNDYAARWAEALRENAAISADFHVTVHAVGRIRLKSRTEGVLDISVTENMTSTEFTVVDGIDPNTEENLAAALEVWIPNEFAHTPDTLVASLQGTYGATTGQTEFNLKGLFPVKPSLPAENSIGVGISLSWRRAIATGAWVEYYLRLADRYGSPPVPEALLKSADNYICIHGARPEDHDTSSALVPVRIPLHGYTRADGGTFRKPVTDVQPDWAYIYTKVEITACSVEFEVTWEDGTVTIETPSGSAFTLLAKKVYWIRSTPYDASAITPPTAGLLPWYYTFRLKGNAGSGVETIHEVFYIIKPCTDWDIYALLDNGLGGCESVLFRGKTAFGQDVSRDIARRARTSDFSIKEGEIINFNAEGQKVFDLNTGYHELYYIQHLRQLLYGDVWLIDTRSKRFLKLVVDTSSFSTHESDGDLYSLSLKVKTAWLDAGHNP